VGRVVYVRHGQASLFSDNYDQLSSLGHLQSQRIGEFYSDQDLNFDKIFIGPLLRHKQTLEGICSKFPKLKLVQLKVLDGLKEHQGYKSMQAILPDLVENDKIIRELVSIPFQNKEEQILHHIRIYEHFSIRWAKGEFNHLLSGHFQSWSAFCAQATIAYKKVWNSTIQGENVLVITSGGPTSVAYGIEKKLNDPDILRFSSKLYNGSMTIFTKKRQAKKVTIANSIDHFSDRELRTLV
jgi:broad specificity phosphatase PhoE